MSEGIVVELLDATIEVETIGTVPIVVTLLSDDITCEVLYDGPIGPRGLTGPAGPIGGYSHTQGVAAATWTIAHNLGLKPGVSVFTSGGVEIEGDVLQLSDNVTQITFLTPIAGVARLA